MAKLKKKKRRKKKVRKKKRKKVRVRRGRGRARAKKKKNPKRKKKKKLKRRKPKRRKAKRRKPAKKKKKRPKKVARKKRKSRTRPTKIEAFNFPPGKRFSSKYEVISQLGAGWEAEVYLIREIETGILRAAKIFFPHRNPRNKVLKFYAKKLHKLRECSVLIQYHTMESFYHEGALVTALVSEYVEGELLANFLKRQKGQRMHYFQALHLLHALARGMEQIHQAREYHGDLHSENVIIRRQGLGFDLKILDFFHWAAPRPENIRDDVVAMIRVFHETLGGKRAYAKVPDQVKEIICGLKIGLIWKKFPTAGHLRRYLETMVW